MFGDVSHQSVENQRQTLDGFMNRPSQAVLLNVLAKPDLTELIRPLGEDAYAKPVLTFTGIQSYYDIYHKKEEVSVMAFPIDEAGHDPEKGEFSGVDSHILSLRGRWSDASNASLVKEVIVNLSKKYGKVTVTSGIPSNEAEATFNFSTSTSR